MKNFLAKIGITIMVAVILGVPFLFGWLVANYYTNAIVFVCVPLLAVIAFGLWIFFDIVMETEENGGIF